MQDDVRLEPFSCFVNVSCFGEEMGRPVEVWWSAIAREDLYMQRETTSRDRRLLCHYNTHPRSLFHIHLRDGFFFGSQVGSKSFGLPQGLSAKGVFKTPRY